MNLVGRAQGLKSNGYPGTGLYVDVENVEAYGRELISSPMGNWPDKSPQPCQLALYVRANSTELWDASATHSFPDISVTVRGVQHYTKAASKNACDTAIAADAMSGLLLGRVSHVAALSDDSDFISLYSAIRRECGGSGADSEVQFLWLMTNRPNTRTATALEFFPDYLIHVVALPECVVGTSKYQLTSPFLAWMATER